MESGEQSEAEAEQGDLLFTIILALLVAVPCGLVATALYSSESLTAHLPQ